MNPPRKKSHDFKWLKGSYQNLVTQLDRHWALAWSISHVLGLLVGGYYSEQILRIPAFAWLPLGILGGPWLVRISGIILAILIHIRATRWKALAIFFALNLGVIWGAAEHHIREQQVGYVCPDPDGPAISRRLEGRSILRVTSWPTETGQGRWKAAGIILIWKVPGDQEVADIPRQGQGCLIYGEGPVPVPGQLLAGYGAWSYPRTGDLPGSFDYREFLAGRNVKWTAYLENIQLRVDSSMAKKLVPSLRHKLLDSIHHSLPSREAAIVSSVLLGTRSKDSRHAAQPFAELGLAHLFAVSGLHVGVLLGLVTLPLQKLGSGSGTRLLLMAVLLPLYGLITGFPGSVVRAAGLALLLGGAPYLGRRADSLQLVGFLFWVTTLLQPTQVLDAGTRLSYLAAGGIVGSLRLLRWCLVKRFHLDRLGSALHVSLAAQWFTLPQVALSFGRFSLLAPLANLLAVPCFAIGVWAMALALAVGWICPWLGQALAAWAWLVFRGLSGLTSLVSEASGGSNVGLGPGNPWTLAAWLGLTLLLVAISRSGLKSKGSKFPLAGLLILLWTTGHFLFAAQGKSLLQHDQPLVFQFDVGQGDCSVLRFPDGVCFIIDTAGLFRVHPGANQGPFSRSVGPFLKRAHVSRIESAILTHDHLDHTGGKTALAENFMVESWRTRGQAAVLHRWENWTFELLDEPDANEQLEGKNNRSLVCLLSREGKGCMLWSGDLENQGEKNYLTAGQLPADVQVWKAGHHGSNTSGSSEWIAHLNPQLVLVSCGLDNKYGHPNHGKYLAGGSPIPVVRTDLEGSIRLSWTPQGGLHWQTGQNRGYLAPSP